MADGSSSKRKRRIDIMKPKTPGVRLKWSETQEQVESLPVQQLCPAGSGKNSRKTDCGYEGSIHSEGEKCNFSSDDEDVEDADKAPYTSVGRPVPLNTSDGEDENEGWVDARKKVRFSEDAGAASAGAAGGAAHEHVHGDRRKEQGDEYEGSDVRDDEANPYLSYEEWRQRLEKEEDGTVENHGEGAAEAQIHEETKSESEVQCDDATAKKAAGVSKELWKENGAAAEAGAAEYISDFPQRQEHVAPKDAPEAGASGAADGASDGVATGASGEPPVALNLCAKCGERIRRDQRRGRDKSGNYFHHECRPKKVRESICPNCFKPRTHAQKHGILAPQGYAKPAYACNCTF